MSNLVIVNVVLSIPPFPDTILTPVVKSFSNAFCASARDDITPVRFVRSKLYYNDGSTVRNNPGGNYLVYSMRINDLYDPDPAILTGSVSNFKEMMQFYSYYKVEYSDIEWTLINLENFPLSCGIVFSQSNLTGVISSLADAQNALENDFTTGVRTVSAKGGIDKTTFTITKFDIHQIS